MLLDEREIVSLLLLRPLSYLLVWAVQWCFTLVRWAYLLWGLTQPKHVVTKAGMSADELLLFVPAVDLAAKIRNGEITASQLIETYIRRIEVVDAQIHAVVQKNYEDARLQAKRIDEFLASVDRESEEFRKLAEEKPLLAIPFSIKDQFFIKGLKTTVGMVCFKDLLAAEDAVIVKNMRNAGAVPLVVTNVPEGLNKIYPHTVNPFDSRMATGGSSSGEGALIGAGGSVMGIGTDIAGSIRVPALMNGIFGLKPGPHLYPSLEGMVPNQLCGYQNEMFGMGPMTRYAKDLMPVFKILIGPENSKALRLDEPVDLSALRFYAMKGTSSRICSQPLDADVAGAFRKTVKHFGTVGKQPVETVTLPLAQYAANYWFVSMFPVGGMSIAAFFGGFGTSEPVNFFREFPKWLRGTSNHTSGVMLGLGVEQLAKWLPFDRTKVEGMRDQLRAEIIELLGEDGILIFPSFPHASYVHTEFLWNFLQGENTAIFNALALPAIACPVGLNEDGIPLGVQLVSAPQNERLLIAAAAEFERAFGGWVPPPGSEEAA